MAFYVKSHSPSKNFGVANEMFTNKFFSQLLRMREMSSESGTFVYNDEETIKSDTTFEHGSYDS